jgi:hypothetical protein
MEAGSGKNQRQQETQERRQRDFQVFHDGCPTRID